MRFCRIRLIFFLQQLKVRYIDGPPIFPRPTHETSDLASSHRRKRSATNAHLLGQGRCAYADVICSNEKRCGIMPVYHHRAEVILKELNRS